MNRPVLMRLALGVGVLVMMTLSLTDCGSGAGSAQEEQAKASPLPEAHQDLRPGEYRTEEFKPSASFKVGKGWLTSPPEASDVLELEYGMTTGLAFSNVREVYKPTESGTEQLGELPEDLAAWFQHHP